MPKRQAAAFLIVCGVVLALVTTAVAIAGGPAAIAIGGPGHLLLIACLGLLGVGVALLGVSGSVFEGTRAGRALKILGFGLVGDSVILAASGLPGLDGSNMIVLFIPFFVCGWATIIGTVLTVRALWTAGGRSRVTGALFLVAAVALLVVIGSLNDLTRSEVPLVAIAFGAVAGGALLLGFLGLAWIGSESASSAGVVGRTSNSDIG